MSRVGLKPVELTEGVSLKIEGNLIEVSGPKGSLKLKLFEGFSLEQKDNFLHLKLVNESSGNNQLFGLQRTLIANMVEGVTKGYQKKLEVNGVGFKVNLQGNKLTLNLGFSHPIEYNAPEGVDLKVEQNIITISGSDKQKIGQTAATIRDFRKPEPYKGKGIKYIDEVVRRKAGKAAVKTEE